MLIQVDKSGINLFVLCSYEYLVRLEGKIRDGIFFCVNKSDNNSVYISIYGLISTDFPY